VPSAQAARVHDVTDAARQGLAGRPAMAGLYTAIFPPIVYCLFGGSSVLSLGVAAIGPTVANSRRRRHARAGPEALSAVLIGNVVERMVDVTGDRFERTVHYARY
jgi:MFS superfamily sulfate permease-like transporter